MHLNFLDFYPDDFQIDLNGKKFAWQGVALLPFVDESRLLESLADVYQLLNDSEKERNEIGPDRVFIGSKHEGFDFLKQIYEDGSTDPNADWIDLEAKHFYGMAGYLKKDRNATMVGSTFVSPLPQYCPDIGDNQTLMAEYMDPHFEKSHIFQAVKLDGAKTPPPTLKPGDWSDETAGGRYRPQIGFSRSNSAASLGDAGHRMLGHELRFRSPNASQSQLCRSPGPM